MVKPPKVAKPPRMTKFTATDFVEGLDDVLWMTFWTVIIFLVILLSADLFHGRNGNLKPYRRKFVPLNRRCATEDRRH